MEKLPRYVSSGIQTKNLFIIFCCGFYFVFADVRREVAASDNIPSTHKQLVQILFKDWWCLLLLLSKITRLLLTAQSCSRMQHLWQSKAQWYQSTHTFFFWTWSKRSLRGSRSIEKEKKENLWAQGRVLTTVAIVFLLVFYSVNRESDRFSHWLLFLAFPLTKCSVYYSARLFEGWISLSTGSSTIQWIA